MLLMGTFSSEPLHMPFLIRERCCKSLKVSSPETYYNEPTQPRLQSKLLDHELSALSTMPPRLKKVQAVETGRSVDKDRK